MISVELAPTDGPALEIGSGDITVLKEGAGLFPPPDLDETFAQGPDTEGGGRTRSTAQNPVGQGAVLIRGADGPTLLANLRSWQQQVDAVHRYGGTITVTWDELGTTVTYDVVSIRLTSLEQQDIGLGQARSEFEVTYRPYGRLAPVTSVAGTTYAAPYGEAVIPAPGGSADALAKVAVTDLAGQARDYVAYGIEDTYDPSNPVPITLTADLLTGLAGSANTRSGAWSSGSATKRASLLQYPQAVCTTGSQRHTGSWIPTVRCYGSGTGPIYVRLASRVGSGTIQHGEWIPLAQIAQWVEIELDHVQIDEAVVGDQGWEGWVESYTDTIGDTLDVDYVAMMPACRYGVAASAPVTDYSSAPSAHDEFDQVAGALSGKPLPSGGNWVTTGAPADYQVNATLHCAERTATGDASLGGKWATAPPTLDSCVVRGDIWFSAAPNGNLILAGFARTLNTNNYLLFQINPYLGVVAVGKRIAGVVSTLGRTQASAFYKLPNTWYSAIIAIDTQGNWTLQGGVKGAGFVELLSGQDNDLATGGVLASGACGLYDEYQGTAAVTRRYDNVIAFPGLAARHMIESNRSLVFDADHAETEPAGTGTVWTPTSIDGGYPRVRPDASSRIVVRARRKNIALASVANVSDQTMIDVDTVPRVQLIG